MKPGWRTTEFWLSLVASILGFAIASGVIPADSMWEKMVALLVSVLATLGYQVTRTSLKKGK